MKTAKPTLSPWKNLLFACVAFSGFFALLELALMLAGVKPAAAVADPYIGFSGLPLYVPHGDSLTTAPAKTVWFNPQVFARRKPASAYRIFAVGGSTTYGRPYEDAHSFSGWLRELAPLADPSREWEVINAGGVSYASYRVASVMEELADYEPDLFIVYSGNNEFLERRTYSKLIEAPAAVLKAGGVLSRTRIYAFGQSLLAPPTKRLPGAELAAEVDTALAHSVGPEDYFRDDQFREQVVGHYRYNLRRMARIARDAGAQILFVTPASNLKDISPFKSQPSAGLTSQERGRVSTLLAEAAALDPREALGRLDEAIELDPRYAESHYARGRVLAELGRDAAAKQAFTRALVEDVCPLRALPSMVEAVREAAAETAAPLVDFAAYMERSSPGGIAGADRFLDHVHLTIDGYRELALLLVDSLEREGLFRRSANWNEVALAAVRQRVEARLDRAAYGRSLHNLARVLGWAGKVEEAARVARQSLEEVGDDTEAYSALARGAAARGRGAEAIEYFRRAIDLQPNNSEALTSLAAQLFKQGGADEALSLLQRALRADPGNVEAYVLRGSIRSWEGDSAAAVENYLDALRVSPRSLAALNNLGVELSAEGRLDEAVTRFEQALQIDPRFVDALNNLGQALTRLGRLDQAKARLERAIEISPATAALHYNLGVALQTGGEIESAVEQYAQALEIDPGMAKVHQKLGLALIDIGRTEEAPRHLRRFLELNPQFASEHPEVGELFDQLSEP